MNKQGINLPVIIGALVVVLVAIGGFWKVKQNQHVKAEQLLAEAREQVAQAQTELVKIRTSSNERLDLIQEMSKMKAFNTKSAEEIERVSQFLKGAELKTQIDLDQFDSHQNNLSNKVAEYFAYVQKTPALASSSAYKAIYKKFETVERSIETSRNQYTQLAQKANQKILTHEELKKVFNELPVFKATAQALDATQSTNKKE